MYVQTYSILTLWLIFMKNMISEQSHVQLLGCFEREGGGKEGIYYPDGAGQAFQRVIPLYILKYILTLETLTPHCAFIITVITYKNTKKKKKVLFLCYPRRWIRKYLCPYIIPKHSITKSKGT